MNATNRILLVEDHLESAAAMARLLRMSGYDTCVAGDVHTAQDAAALQPFDLVLCDIGLPDGNGYDLMKQLHLEHGLDGIALTGSEFPKELQDAECDGFQGFLIKPVMFDKLKLVIETYFRSHHRQISTVSEA